MLPGAPYEIRKSSLWLALFALVACELDERALHGVDSSCNDGAECAGHAGTTSSANGGRSSAALGGRSSTSLGGSSVGGSNEGGDSNVGPSLDCVDLDQNTVPDCSETVAKNSGFDRDVKGWSPEANGAIEWNALDARGSTGSGTMRVENRATIVADNGGLVFSGATQCVSIEVTRAYDLFVQMYSRGPTITAYASIVGRVFGSEDCSGAPLRVETSPIQGTIDLWLTLQATVPAVTGAKSLLVELSVGKLSETPGPVSLVFDNVLVR